MKLIAVTDIGQHHIIGTVKCRRGRFAEMANYARCRKSRQRRCRARFTTEYINCMSTYD